MLTGSVEEGLNSLKGDEEGRAMRGRVRRVGEGLGRSGAAKFSPAAPGAHGKEEGLVLK